MLKYYEVENFRSFKNKTTFSLEKTNYKVLEETNTARGLLKGVLFVGANASGKSGALLPVKLLLDMLFGKAEIPFEMYHCLFSMNPAVSMRFLFDIKGSDIDYSIKYHNDGSAIHELLKVDGETVLERENSYAKVSLTDQKEYTDIQLNTLFLREIYFNTRFRGHQVLQEWFSFLSASIYLDLYTRRASVYQASGIELRKYLEEKGTDEINQFFEEYNFGQRVEYGMTSTGKVAAFFGEDKHIFMKRNGINEPILLEMESTGTQNLLNLLPAFFHCTHKGGLLILDEFSSGFHNDLEKLLIRYFMKYSTNAQMLFVTHSTNLLSSSILRPDQLYTVEFGEEGSRIKRFSDEKPREAQNMEKMYLGGVFGGLPRYEN